MFDDALWRYTLDGRSAGSAVNQALRIIETREGEPIGFFVHSPRLWGDTLTANLYEVKDGVSWLAVTPVVVRYLIATGEKYAASEGKERFGAFGFWLGVEHPVYEAFGDRLPRVRQPYAWYIRLPDVMGFLRLIAPALEERLARSVAAGHTGDLQIHSYGDGMRLVFEKGSLVDIAGWKPDQPNDGDAAFPDLTFLQLLLGYRSLDELRHSYADCWAKADEAGLLLNALFPKQHSFVFAIS